MSRCLLPLFIAALFFHNTNGNAQVAIGTDEIVEGALLQINASDKGVLLPKVALLKYDSLAPLQKGNIIPSEKWKMAGTVVYNVNAAAKGINVGIVEWNGIEWVTPGSRTHVAEFEVICQGMSASGYYNKGKILNPFNNTLTVPVSVTLPGLFTITAHAYEGNSSSSYAGFSFRASGEFTAVGAQTIILSGEGKPENSTPINGHIDRIVATLNGNTDPASQFTCDDIVQVDGEEVAFTFNCASITNFVGNPKPGTPITTADNKVVLVNIVSTVGGGQFIIESDRVNGVKLYGSGYLEGNNQTVTLYATGTPTSAGEFTYTLRSNSSMGTAICQVTIEYKN